MRSQPRKDVAIILQKYRQVHIKDEIWSIAIMIYFESGAMTKKQVQVLLPALIIGIGILLALATASFNSFSNPGLGAVTATLTPTVTPAAQATSQAGSTDWITLTGVIIVLIIVLPIIFRRQTWTK